MAFSPKLSYDDFCVAADKLYYEYMEMPTAPKTHSITGHGSLATHQHYLNRWKDSRRKKPSTLPEQLAKKIQEKTKLLAEEIWKAITKTQQEHHQKIQQNAKETIEAAESETKKTIQVKEEIEANFKKLQNQHLTLQQEHEKFVENFSQAEKRGIILEEKANTLKVQLKEYKTESTQQLKYLKEQDKKNRVLFKEQLSEQALQSEKKYNALQKEKNEEELKNKKIKDELTTRQKFLETKNYKNQHALERIESERQQLIQLICEEKSEKEALFKETGKLKSIIDQKKHEVSIAQGEKQQLEKQFLEVQNTILDLQNKLAVNLSQNRVKKSKKAK
jgi:hypothetical protein